LCHAIIQIGGSSTHVSHDLHVYKGHLYCNKCGSKGLSRLRNLAVPCEEPGPYGKSQLRAINKGKLPPGLDEWPDPNVVHAGTLSVPWYEVVIRDRIKPVLRSIMQSQQLEDMIEGNGSEEPIPEEVELVQPPVKRARFDFSDSESLPSDSD